MGILSGGKVLDDIVEANRGFRFWEAVSKAGSFWEKDGYEYTNLMTRLRNYRKPLRAIALSAQMLGLFGAVNCGDGRDKNPLAPTQTVTVPIEPIPTPPPEPPSPTPQPEQPIVGRDPDPSPPAPDVTFIGAGDVGYCRPTVREFENVQATAELISRYPNSRKFIVGDIIYLPSTIEDCIDRTWGMHERRDEPFLVVLGNHDNEYGIGRIFNRFPESTGQYGLGFWVKRIGNWRVYGLNSTIDIGPGSLQYNWLEKELKENSKNRCSLYLIHDPLFNSGEVHGGEDDRVRPAVRLIHKYRGDIIISGDEHDYERFGLQDADGRPDLNGIRAYVVGTGGAPLYERKNKAIRMPNSEMIIEGTHGVLKLILGNGVYSSEFITVRGKSETDFLHITPCVQ